MTSSRLEAIDPPTEPGTDLTYVYTLIHSFLKEKSHTKAASALKKAVTGIVAIDDGAEHEGPTLQKILEEWRELKAAADATDTSSSDSSSDSSNDDSQVEDNSAGKNKSKSKRSESSEDSSDDSDDAPQKVVPQVANLKESQRDSSKTLSSADDVESDEESTDETGSDSSDDSDVDTDSSSVPTFKEGGSKKKTFRAKKPATSSSDVSSSTSDSGSDEEDELPSTSMHKAKSPSTSDSSSSSDSDSDSDEDSKPPPTTNKLKRKAASSSSSDSSSEDDTSGGSSSSSPKRRSTTQAVARSSASSSSSSSRSEDELEETPVLSVIPDPQARATKKRRANEEGTAVTVAVTVKTLAGDAQGGKASRKPNAPFQRVNAHAVSYYDEKLKDNSFESRGARADDYGARANRDLVVTRGDGFRKEKNKKKRGSYRGGDITLHSHSFKFEE